MTTAVVLAIGEPEVVARMSQAKSIARSYSLAKANCDADELTSVAYMAVAEAVRNFDPKRGTLKRRVNFIVRKRISDHLRNMDHMSRPERMKVTDEQRNDRKNGDTFLRFDAMLPGVGSPVSLDIRSREHDVALLNRLRTIDDLSPTSKILLNEVMCVLSDRERVIFRLYYWDQLTMAEIGELLHINGSRVSQLVTNATKRMKDYVMGDLGYAGRVFTNKRRNPGITRPRREDGDCYLG